MSAGVFFFVLIMVVLRLWRCLTLWGFKGIIPERTLSPRQYRIALAIDALLIGWGLFVLAIDRPPS